MNIYNNEIIELEINFLKESRKELIDITFFKIRANSLAHNELKNLISNIDLKLLNLKDKLNNNFSDTKYATIKIDLLVLNELFSLKKELNVETISDLLEQLTLSYQDLFLIDSLVEIKPLFLDKTKEKAFNETDFYICNENNIDKDNYTYIKEKILYKLDDLIIYNNKEYLNLQNFKQYTIGNDFFYISEKYTLSDVDIFISIWKK